MPYVLLGAAISLEIIATTLLKASEGFTKLIPTLFCIVFYVLCFYSFSKALLNINLGVPLSRHSSSVRRSTASVSLPPF